MVATLRSPVTDKDDRSEAGSLSEAPPSTPPVPVTSSPRRSGGITQPALAIKIAVGVVTPLIGGLAVLGGIGSFSTIRDLAHPWFGAAAWIIPVGIDIGILALLAWDLLTEYIGFPWPVLRWTAWAFITATVYLNIAAAHGNPSAAVMHAAMPVLFVTVMEGIRHLIRQWAGLASGTRIDRIPAPRWLLAPQSTFMLARRMILWQITSYPQALALEHQRLRAIARLQESYGRFLWRWKAPLSERLALRFTSAGMSFHLASHHNDDEGQNLVSGLPERSPSIAPLLSQVPQWCLVEPPKVPEPPGDPDRALIEAATAVLRDAERNGDRISQAALARKLRERGHRVANDRLRWLVTAVQTTSAPEIRSML